MAIVIPVEKLIRGLYEIGGVNPVMVKLRNTNTVFRDKVTGWTIVGKEIKELPITHSSPGNPFSQKLFAAIRAGRFVRVISPSDPNSKKKKKYEELVESIITEYDSAPYLEENTGDIQDV